MRILLLPNPQKPHVFSCIRQLTDLLADSNIQLLIDQQLSDRLSGCAALEFGDNQTLLESCDFCLAIGGDGTLIHAAKLAVLADKPLLGINLGRLGFLATLEQDQLSLLHQLESGDYVEEQRMMLEVIHFSGSESRHYLALNDAVICKGSLSRMIDITVTCRGKLVGDYRSDGVIAATPTGSTAYSLSAGGPIIDPAIDCIAFTPISSHSLFSRSILFGAENEIVIRPAGREAQEIFLTVDGEMDVPILSEDRLLIRRSDTHVRLINLTGKQFYEVLNSKLLSRAVKPNLLDGKPSQS